METGREPRTLRNRATRLHTCHQEPLGRLLDRPRLSSPPQSPLLPEGSAHLPTVARGKDATLWTAEPAAATGPGTARVQARWWRAVTGHPRACPAAPGGQGTLTSWTWHTPSSSSSPARAPPARTCPPCSGTRGHWPPGAAGSPGPSTWGQDTKAESVTGGQRAAGPLHAPRARAAPL